MVSVGFAVGFRLGHTDIIHKDGELAHTEIVHARVLVHDAIHHIGIFHETIARVDCPNEIHLRVLRRRCDFANHILREQAVFHLLCRQRRGISGFPLLRMVDIRLGTVHIGIHLHAHHETHEVFLHGHTVGVAIISLYQASTLLICVIIERHFGNVACAFFEHLLQGGQTKECGIGVFADDHDFRAAVSV